MKRRDVLIGCALVAAGLTISGCAMLQPLLGTSTTQANANLAAQLGPYSGLKHAVGCVNFKNEAGWSGQWELGNNMATMLESSLFDTERFVVVEREKLADIVAEQDLVASGRAAKASKVAKKGILQPAKYIATGAITAVEDSKSGGDGGISYGGISLGGGAGKASVTIIAKLIDSSTGQMIAKQRITGTAGKASFNVGLSTHGVSTGFGGFEKTPLAEAAQDCINQAALFFARQIEKMPFDGAVVKVSNGRVIVNRGSETGLSVGRELVMREQGETMTDPDTGAVLGEEPGKDLGVLKVSEVQDKFSTCTVVSGEKNPKTGTVVIEKK
jgi:curli biogenesis system outer membrane secretion channel CsgG